MQQSENNKITVVTKDGKADVEIRQGTTFHVLEDKTAMVMEAANIESFLDIYNSSSKKTFVFANKKEIVVYGFEFRSEISRYTKPLATCVLNEHPKLTFLKRHVSNWMKLEIFEEFLNNFKRDNKSVAELLFAVQNFRINAYEEVVRQKDTRTGSYMFTFSRKVGEKTDKDQILFPPSISIECPVYDGLDENWTFEFEVTFEYEKTEKGVVLQWKLTNFDLNSDIERAFKSVLCTKLGEHDISPTWGSVNLVIQSDSWKYYHAENDR